MSLEAFKSRVLPVKNKLFRFATRLLGDADEAQDLVQDVLIKVWDRHEEMDRLENMEAWCMRITRNMAFDRLKSAKRKRTEMLSQDMEISQGEGETPYQDLETRDTLEQIGGLMDTLPDKQRQVMELRDVEGFSYKEISDILEIDINQVKVSLFRARKQIREQLMNMNAYGLR